MKIVIETTNETKQEEQERINTNIENLLIRHGIRTRKIEWKKT